MAANGRGGASRLSALDGKAPDGQDFANYFCTYAYIYHQASAPGRARRVAGCHQITKKVA
jgi:hypothetical protein